jgi:hypothetical protein
MALSQNLKIRFNEMFKPLFESIETEYGPISNKYWIVSIHATQENSTFLNNLNFVDEKILEQLKQKVANYKEDNLFDVLITKLQSNEWILGWLYDGIDLFDAKKIFNTKRIVVSNDLPTRLEYEF